MVATSTYKFLLYAYEKDCYMVGAVAKLEPERNTWKSSAKISCSLCSIVPRDTCKRYRAPARLGCWGAQKFLSFPPFLCE